MKYTGYPYELLCFTAKCRKFLHFSINFCIEGVGNFYLANYSKFCFTVYKDFCEQLFKICWKIPRFVCQAYPSILQKTGEESGEVIMQMQFGMWLYISPPTRSHTTCMHVHVGYGQAWAKTKIQQKGFWLKKSLDLFSGASDQTLF